MRRSLHTLIAVMFLLGSVEGVIDSVHTGILADPDEIPEVQQHLGSGDMHVHGSHDHDDADTWQDDDGSDGTHTHVCHCGAHAPSIVAVSIDIVSQGTENPATADLPAIVSFNKPPPLPPPIA